MVGRDSKPTPHRGVSDGKDETITTKPEKRR
jgi:hypothetical protein